MKGYIVVLNGQKHRVQGLFEKGGRGEEIPGMLGWTIYQTREMAERMEFEARNADGEQDNTYEVREVTIEVQ